METKVCNKCFVERDISRFEVRNDTGKIRPSCKECYNKKRGSSRHTKSGMLSVIYSSQVGSSKKRNHPMPTYTLIEFKDWAMSQPLFHVLYDNWQRLDYQKMYVPSVDRKEDSIPYTMSNIQLCTFQDNLDKAGKDRMSGKNPQANKAVDQLTLNGELVNTFHSMAEATRRTSISGSGISNTCSGKKKHAGGYKWRYADE